MEDDGLTPMEHRILEGARFVMRPWMNIAIGTPGDAVHRLVERGFMREVKVPATLAINPYSEDAAWTYEVTRQGRDAYVSYGPPYVPRG